MSFFILFNMKNILNYYYNIYRQYEKINKDILDHFYCKMMPSLLRLSSKRYPRININRFIGEIKRD